MAAKHLLHADPTEPLARLVGRRADAWRDASARGVARMALRPSERHDGDARLAKDGNATDG